MARTRIKICGITRACDLEAAVEAGVDALGFVFYPPSPRCLTADQAADLARRVPPFVTRVGLFVNPDADAVRAILRAVPLDLLQFHGEEPAGFCGQFDRPYIKAARVRPGVDLLEFACAYPAAQALLLDAWVDAYGGVGQSFDWSLVPAQFPGNLVLSGGLHAGNVAEAVCKVRPWAVDVSSGVESAKGIKDADKMNAFVAAVKRADVER